MNFTSGRISVFFCLAATTSSCFSFDDNVFASVALLLFALTNRMIGGRMRFFGRLITFSGIRAGVGRLVAGDIRCISLAKSFATFGMAFEVDVTLR